MTTQTITPNAGLSGTLSSPGRAARIAGVSYLLMFALAIFANFVVLEGLIEPGNAAATVSNLTESMGLYRLGLISFLTIFVLDVVIAWALYVVFRSADRDLSLATAWFRLIYTALLGVGLIWLFQVPALIDGPSYLASDQIAAQTMLVLESFESAWLIGLAAFGIHLVLLGVLVVRSGLMSRVLGYILAFAGVAYLIDTLAHGLLSDYEAVAGLLLVIVALPSMIGEGWLGLSLAFSRRMSQNRIMSA